MKARFGSFQIDGDSFELTDDGERVPVEPQVFRLLQFLIEHRDRVVTKAEMIEKVWDGRAVSDYALSSAVKAARRALGDKGPEVIRTVHGRGVRFVAPVAAVAEAPREPVPDRAQAPSIVVLPFRNVSSDPEQQHFADGISVDVTDLLAHNRWLRVIGSSSAFALDAERNDLRRAGEELGVRYAVEGSVRRAGERVRVSAALFTVADGRRIWSERYDREIGDVFALQDELAQAIAATVEPELAAAEATSVRSVPTADLDAWDSYHRGVSDLYSFDFKRFESAKAHLEQAIALDPDFAAAHARLAYVHIQRFWSRPMDEREANVARAEALARRAISLDDRESLGYFALGTAMMLQGRFDDALLYLGDALERHPGHAQPHIAMGETLCMQGRYAEAVAQFDLAERLSPHDPHIWSARAYRGLALSLLGQEDDAIASVTEAVRHPRASFWAHAVRTAVLGAAGRDAEARAARAELEALEPAFDMSYAEADFSFVSSGGLKDRYLDGLRRAGIPTHARGSAGGTPG